MDKSKLLGKGQGVDHVIQLPKPSGDNEMDNESSETIFSEKDGENELKRSHYNAEVTSQKGQSQSLRKLSLDALLTPPPTRQQTPTSLILPKYNASASTIPHSHSLWRSLPSWAVVSLQLLITMPLYIFSFWLMIEGIKAGGDTLIHAIDYLAFRP